MGLGLGSMATHLVRARARVRARIRIRVRVRVGVGVGVGVRVDGDAQLEEAVGPREYTGALHEDEDVALAHVVLELAQVAQVVRVEEDPLLEEAWLGLGLGLG